MNDTTELLRQFALKYAAQSYSLIPIGKDKKPLVKWQEYQIRRATEEEINQWFIQWPDMNIGIVTGKISNLVVIDIDPRHGGSDEQFKAILTPHCRTGGGGWHYYFSYTDGVKNKAGLWNGIDIRGDGGYVIVPPSLHESSGRYQWVISLEAKQPIPLPDFVLNKIHEEKKQDHRQAGAFDTKKVSGVEEGVRNDSAASVIGKFLSRFPKKEWKSIVWPMAKNWNTNNNPPMEEDELRDVFDSISERELTKRNSTISADETERIIKINSLDRDVNFAQWQNTIKSNFPDLLFPAEYGLSIMSQILITDITNPFSLVFVDVPSAGKTIAINFFADIDGLTYATDKFTPASFVSNAANVKKEKLADIDLLPRLKYKMFLIRDLATIFSKREDDLNETLGLLTRVLDGEGLNADTGVHGQRHYTGEYLFMILAASTPIQPRVWKMMGNLGSRLFFLNMASRDKSDEELADQITTLPYREKEKICRSITKDFLYSLWFKYPQGVEWNKQNDEKEYKLVIARCARLLAKLRGVINVWKDRSQDGESYDYTHPVIEKPDRINQLFYNLCRGHALAGGRIQINKHDLRLIVELSIDRSPTVRAKLFR